MPELEYSLKPLNSGSYRYAAFSIFLIEIRSPILRDDVAFRCPVIVRADCRLWRPHSVCSGFWVALF
jgi:hypothetical protein